jgi:hypothetical protein
MQLLVCGILIFRGHYRKFPFFTSYIALNICQAVFLYVVYNRYGDTSHEAYVAAWRSEAITLLARLLATIEVLRLAMISYRGIWGLAWRLLAATSLLVLIFVCVASRGNMRWAMIEADRDYNLIFATALVACLALIRYYLISIDSIYKTLLATFCFYSCIKILINTILQGFLYTQFAQSEIIWQIVTTFAYLIILAYWAAALAHPLPAIKAQRAVLPVSVYQRISPEIHFQLQAINKQLMNLLRLEGPRH